MKKFLGLIRHGLVNRNVGLLIIIGLLAALVWFVGPLIAVADNRYLAGVKPRLIVIAILMLLWLISVSIYFVRRARKKQKETLPSDAPELVEAAAQAEIRHAMTALVIASQRELRGEHRRTPLYLVMSHEAAELPELITAAGIELLDTNLETTPNALLHYWVCDGAIFVQPRAEMLNEQGATDDATELSASLWKLMQQQLAHWRKAQPLQGVLLLQTVARLVQADSLSVNYSARFWRGRLASLRRQLSVYPPVYFMLTRADHISGFVEFFGHSESAECDAPLGVVFDPNVRNGQFAVSDSFTQRFSELVRSLSVRTSKLLVEERDVDSRPLIAGFSKQLTVLQGTLYRYLMLLLDVDRQHPEQYLRGVWLSSAQQSGRPIHLLGESARRSLELERPVARDYRGRWRRYFVKGFWHEVAAQEQGLADRSAPRVRQQRRRIATTLLLGSVAIAGTAYALSQNHGRNEKITAQAERHLEHYQLEQRGWPRGQNRRLLRYAPGLTALNEAVQSYSNTPAVPWMARQLYGLPQKQSRVTQLYHAELWGPFMQSAADQVRDELKFRATSSERQQEALRVYLMLNDAENLRVDDVQGWFVRHWAEQRLPAQQQHTLRDLLADALEQKPRPLIIDDVAVAQARERLVGNSRHHLSYNSLLNSRSASQRAPFVLSGSTGPELIANFEGGHKGVPASHTLDGYTRWFQPTAEKILRGEVWDYWLLGKTSAPTLDKQSRQKLLSEMETAYARDYIVYWKRLLNGLKIRPVGSLADARERLASLTGPQSPLRDLAAVIQRQTFVASVASAKNTDPNDPVAIAQRATDQQPVRSRVRRSFSELQNWSKPSDLERRSGMENNIDVLLAVQQEIEQILADDTPDKRALTMAREAFGGERVSPLARMRALSHYSPAPMAGWYDKLHGQIWQALLASAQREVDRAWRAEVLPEWRKKFATHYPFDRISNRDTALADLSEFFGSEGTLVSYYNKYLADFIDTDTGELRRIAGHRLPVNINAVKQIRRSLLLRKRVLNASDDLALQFRIRPHLQDYRVTRSQLVLADKQLSYAHGPVFPQVMRWPSGERGYASIAFETFLDNREPLIKEFFGTWALFRMLDLGSAYRLEQNGEIEFKMRLGDSDIAYRLQPVGDGKVLLPDAFDIDLPERL